MPLGYDRRLFLLAYDHRASFSRDLFGIRGTPTHEEAARISEAKSVIFDGFRRALALGAPREESGILVDEQYGVGVAELARADQCILAMPVEASGRREFDLEFGDDFGWHIEHFDPTFAKVLVRYNPEEREVNARQQARLRLLSDWLHEHGRKFLFELLVPATANQLALVGRDAARYDAELRPALVLATIAELQDAGVEPDVWKIEGLDRREDGVRVAGQARRGGRDGVACIVLGRGADQERVDHWLRTGAGVDGFAGFAIGRTLWWEPLAKYRDAEVDRAAAAEHIAASYLRAIDVYRTAATEARRGPTPVHRP
jgi:myo-inositol catabolism protein IolC